MLKDFSSEIELKRMSDKIIAEQAIEEARKGRDEAKKMRDDVESDLYRLESEQRSLALTSKFNPITRFFSSIFKRGRYYEYVEKGKEAATKIENAKRSLQNAEKEVESKEKELDGAIKRNDEIIIPKQYEKGQDNLLKINDLDGLNHERTKDLPKDGRVMVHCTDFFPFSGEIVSNFEGEKVLDKILSYNGVYKKVSSISNRHEVHYTLNARVESTGDGAGNWDSPKFMIVDSVDDNEWLNKDNTENDAPSDSWTKGKNIKLSSQAVIVVREDALEELNLSPEDMKNHRVMIYSGDPTKCLQNFLTLNNYKIQETDPNYFGHAQSIRMKQEYSEDLRNYAIHFVTNEPVLTKERPVLDAAQLGYVMDVYMQNNPESVIFSQTEIGDRIIETYMKDYDIAPEDKEKYIQAINFAIMTGLTRTEDGKGFTFKESEQIIDGLQYFAGRMDLISSPDKFSIPTSELVFDIFQARKNAEIEYSKLKTPSVESVKEMTMEQLSMFKNQKGAEVVTRAEEGDVIIFAFDEFELRRRYPGLRDFSLKYKEAVEAGKDMPKCRFDRVVGDDYLINSVFSGNKKVSELGDCFENLEKLVQEINDIKLKSPNEVAKESEEGSRPADL